MQSSDLSDLIQILDRDLPIVSPPHEPDIYYDPDAIMFHMNNDDIDPYFCNPVNTPEEPELKRVRKTGVRIKYWEKVGA
jgi:hypothetical protein